MEICWHFRKFNWRRFKQQVPAQLITEWCEWLKLRPQGQHHRDKMLAIIGAAFCNTQRGSEDEPLKPEDFMYYEEPEPVPEAQQKAYAEVVLAMLRARQAQQQTSIERE